MLVEANGTQLFVERLGAGVPMLVLHGGLGLDHTYFRPWLDPLAQRVELLYVDLRGNGRSERPADWSAIDHDVWVEDLEQLRRKLDLPPLIVFGHSYGGYFAQEWALRHPDSVRGLVLCDTSPRADHDAAAFEALAGRATPEQLQTLATAFSSPFTAGEEAFAILYRQVLPLYFAHPDDATMDAMIADMRVSPGAFNRGFLECRPHFDTRDRLASIEVPTLVAAGRHDWIVPPEAGAQRLHAELPDSEMKIFEDSGHFPFIEENAAFLAAVEDWLERRAFLA